MTMLGAYERFCYLFLAVVVVAACTAGLSGCISSTGSSRDGTGVQATGGVATALETLSVDVAAVKTSFQAGGDFEAALAKLETTVDAAVVSVRETNAAGRDVNQMDYWSVRAGLVLIAVYLVVDRVLDRRRPNGRAATDESSTN